MVSTKLFRILSSTLMESKWCKEKQQSTATLKLHKPKLDEITAALDMNLQGEKQNALPKKLSGIVRDMLYLTEEVDVATMSPLVRK